MADLSVSDKKARFEEKIHQLGITPFWLRERSPKSDEPRVDRWSTLYPLLLEAAELVTLGAEAERRAMGYQIVMPGETAPAHRHAFSAMRFIVKGDGLGYTTTNGEQMFMEPGDLLVQPSYSWHDHGNLGKEPVIWVDILDTEVIQPLLQAKFHEDWPDGNRQPVTHADGYHAQLYGNVRPARLIGAQLGSIQDSPPITYKFKDALAALERMAAEEEHDPHDGVLLEYANPITGGHTLPTVSTRIQMLRPGEVTRPHRHTGFAKYVVVQGQGVSAVDMENPTELDWEDHDIFRIPSWRWHQHRNRSATEPAILFSISYSPLAEALGLYREEKG